MPTSFVVLILSYVHPSRGKGVPALKFLGSYSTLNLQMKARIQWWLLRHVYSSDSDLEGV